MTAPTTTDLIFGLKEIAATSHRLVKDFDAGPAQQRQGSLAIAAAYRLEILTRLADHAETLLCNAVPEPHCPSAEWQALVKSWRDLKHDVSK